MKSGTKRTQRDVLQTDEKVMEDGKDLVVVGIRRFA